jgi:hypothetical protein
MNHTTALQVAKTLKELNVPDIDLHVAAALAWAMPLPVNNKDDALGFYAKHCQGYIRDSVSDINESVILKVPYVIQKVREFYDARLLCAYSLGCQLDQIIPKIDPNHVGAYKQLVDAIEADYVAQGMSAWSQGNTVTS